MSRWLKVILILLLPGAIYALARMLPEAREQTVRATQRAAGFPLAEAPAVEPSANDELVAVVVGSVGRDSRGQPVVLLEAEQAHRALPIFVGPNEALAIATEMARLRLPRPMTHDLLKSAIEALGGRVRHVVITDLRQGTFFAQIRLERNGEGFSIDARPSDSIALALRCEAPIAVRRALFERESIEIPAPRPEQAEPEPRDLLPRPRLQPPVAEPTPYTI